MKRHGAASASALIRGALRKELGANDEAAKDSEDRTAAALERLGHDVSRALQGQQTLFAVLDTFVKGFLTCVPEPPSNALAQSVARARDRHAQFIKSAGQAIAANGTLALSELIRHAD
jgi:hypothetical protein